MHDAQEALVRRKDPDTASEGVALKEALQGVFAEHLDHPAAFVSRGLVPLEIPARVLEHGVEFVADKLIGREYAKCLGVVDDDLIQKAADRFHRALLSVLLDGKLLPFRNLQRHVHIVRLLPLPELLVVVFRDDAQGGLDDLSIVPEELFRAVAGQPLLERPQLLGIGLGGRERDLM